MSRMIALVVVVAGASLAAAAGPFQGPMQGPIQGPMQGPVYVPTKVVAGALPICCDRCIDYKHLRPRLEPCGPHYETNMLVKDNWDCCYVQVPMCLPDCCTGEPQVCYKGKHVVEYSWCSGYKVRVILTKRGKVLVHYNVA